VLVAILAAAVLAAYSGWYDVSARRPHTVPVAWLLSTVAHHSIERRAADTEVPGLDDESLIQAGVSDYDAICVVCRRAPGKERGAVGNVLYSQPADLTHAADHMRAAEILRVTRDGIRMRGMPACCSNCG
jgi:hypothetical protein